MELDGNSRKQLSSALTKAFPTKSDWERMVGFELNQPLDMVSTLGNIDNIAFEVIRWAISRGRLNDLVNGARRHNETNPELHQFYREVWQPLQDTDSKLRNVSQTPVPVDVSTTLPEADTSLSTLSSSENNGASPDPINTIPPLPAEQLRKCLLAHTLNVREAIQKAQNLFTLEREVYWDEYQVVFKHLRQKNVDLHTILSKLLKKQLVKIELHSQFGADKDYFKEEMEKVLPPLVGQPNSQVPLPYTIRQDMYTKLAPFQKDLDDIDHYISNFCSQIDQCIDLDQLGLCTRDANGSS